MDNLGLDVWAVKTEYRPLKRPDRPVYDFLFDLLLDPDTGLEDSCESFGNWGHSWANNGVYEFSRVGLRARARNWADSRKLSQIETTELDGWIDRLPWEEDHVMLMIGN